MGNLTDHSRLHVLADSHRRVPQALRGRIARSRSSLRSAIFPSAVRQPHSSSPRFSVCQPIQLRARVAIRVDLVA
jgi:hypothetical protein